MLSLIEVNALLSIHIVDEIYTRHGIMISDSCESLPMAVPRETRLQNGLSCAHSTGSGQVQGSLMNFVPSWRPNTALKSRYHLCPGFVPRLP